MKPRALIAASFVGLAGLFVNTPSAAASYSPRFTISLRPSTAATAPAITSAVTYQQGDTATKTVRVHYPPQFGFNPSFAVTGCPPAAENSDSCPSSSQIGNASAETMLGSFSGPVYFTPDYRLLIYLRGAGGLIQDKFVGYFQDAPDGGVDAVIDNLPDFPSSSSTIALDGGSRSPLLTPEVCGSYPITGHFTSHNGEQATSTADVRITGCDSHPTIARVWLDRSRVSAHAPGRVAGDTVHWELSDSGGLATVSLERLRSVRGMQIWHLLWSRAGTAREGINSLRFRAAAGGHALLPGRYRLLLAVFSRDGIPSDRLSTELIVARTGQTRSPPSCIPQGARAGDADADNHGGPSDGDGCI